MSLLTDAEINEARAPHIGLPLKCWPQHRAIADASQTVTIKAVAEWLSQKCDVESHSRYRNGRASCPLCLANVIICGIEGKLPGGNDATTN